MKTFRLYNTLTKKAEEYDPQNRDIINIYSCGPTVYDHSHLGHARSSITWDFIVRFLRFLNYQVVWTRNVTDIDDKIINKAKELKKHPLEIARIFSISYHEDMLALNVSEPDYEPRATEYIFHMKNIIDSLIAQKHAYQIENDIYFSVATFKNYGLLKGQSISELEKGFGRIEPNPKKNHKLDFALWKGTKDNNEYGFESAWGKGRPGWHIECTSMCDAIYNGHLDLHCGGDDLIFPHHENEIAQFESINKLFPFARYWLHNGMIMVDSKKMAKSEGNFITIKDALRETSANAIRFFILNSHYRMPLNYTHEGILSAQNGINRLKEALSLSLPDVTYLENSSNVYNSKNEYIEEFTTVMSDDFNSPQALAILFKLTDRINTEKIEKTKHELQRTLLYLSTTLGFNLIKETKIPDKTFSDIVENLILWRFECKSNKDFKTADKIRELLTSCKIEVKDLPENRYKWQIKT